MALGLSRFKERFSWLKLDLLIYCSFYQMDHVPISFLVFIWLIMFVYINIVTYELIPDYLSTMIHRYIPQII